MKFKKFTGQLLPNFGPNTRFIGQTSKSGSGEQLQWQCIVQRNVTYAGSAKTYLLQGSSCLSWPCMLKDLGPSSWQSFHQCWGLQQQIATGPHTAKLRILSNHAATVLQQA